MAQDYLKVIWTVQEWSRERVSTKLLSERIGVSASTVSEAIRKLSDQGLVDHARYGSIALTDAGRSAAVSMVRRHRLIETFLVNELGYGWDEVHDEAEVLEHAVSDRMIDRIDAKLGFPNAIRTVIPSRQRTDRCPLPGAATERLPGRRVRAGRPDLRRRSGDAPLLRFRRHRTRHRHHGDRAARLRGHRVDSARHRPATGNVDLGNPAAQAIWLV